MFDKRLFERKYKVMNLTDRILAVSKPSAMSMFSQMIMMSGTTIAQDLNRAFKFSGSSVLPAYPGFIVIKNPTVSLREISSS